MIRMNNKKIIGKRIILVVSLLVAVLVCSYFAQHYIMTRLDVTQRRLQGFYMEEKNSLDMVILGSSETYNGYAPPKAYEKYGITSYLYGYQANPVTLWKYQLKEIERTQNPKVLIIECNGAVYDEDGFENPAEVRFMTDDMPFSMNKVHLIREEGTESTLSYYFPILKYHTHLIPGNGTKSKILMEERGFNILRGTQARVAGDPISKKRIDVTGDTSMAELDPVAEESLTEFLKLCQESDIEHIVFVRFPHVVTDYNYKRFQRYHKIREMVESYGFDYVDMDQYMDDMEMTFEEDFLDCEHLNAKGARKLTDFMVGYMVKTYNMEPRKQSTKVVDQWEDSVEYYNHLYDYWSYFKETYPNVTAGKYNLDDDVRSNMRINAYVEGHPIPPAKKDLNIEKGN